MAGKIPDDMPVVQDDDYKLPAEIASSIQKKDGDLQLPDWLLRITREATYSTYADKEGTELGEFMCKNVKLVEKVNGKRNELVDAMKNEEKNKETPRVIPEISVTFFKNWADTVEGLMLLAKPNTVSQVEMLVHAAKNVCQVKVLSYDSVL